MLNILALVDGCLMFVAVYCFTRLVIKFSCCQANDAMLKPLI